MKKSPTRGPAASAAGGSLAGQGWIPWAVGLTLLSIAAILGALFYLLAPSHWDTSPAGAQDMGALLLRNVKLEHLTGRPYLGLTYQELSRQAGESPAASGVAGALVTSLAPGGPAAMAGLTTGDVILAIDAQSLSPENPLVKVLLDRRAGDRVKLLVQRGRDHMNLEVRPKTLRSGPRRQIPIVVLPRNSAKWHFPAGLLEVVLGKR